MTSGTERTGLPVLVADALDTALGRAHRDDPARPRTGGPAGNALLTAWTGLILLVLSVAELATLVNVSGLISWHIVIGALLIPPALLKTASTGWRIVGYYRRDAPYRRAGPPPTLLRLLGPLVVASTVGLLASGVLLIILGQDRSRSGGLSVLGHRLDVLTAHKALFLVWAALTGLHVLARTVPAFQLAFSRRRERAVDGARARAVTLVATMAAAGVVAAIVLSGAGAWRHDGGHRRPGDRDFGPRAASSR